MNMRKILAGALFALTVAASPTGAWAANTYPDHPIRLIVAFAPGTGSDTLARLLATGMGPALGQSVVVENKPGGGGILGTELTAHAAPDGYTITLGTTSTLITNPEINPNAHYRVDRDFAAVAGLAQTAFVIVTSSAPGMPASLAELAAKLRRGGQAYASSGLGTVTQLASELYLHTAELHATHVPYKGSSQSLADVAAGRVLFATDTLAAALPLIRSGRLRALAVTGKQRSPALPDVPTVAQSGYPGFVVQAWFGLMAPAGTPPAVIERLSQAARQALDAPSVRRGLQAMALDPAFLSPVEFSAYIGHEYPFWSKFIQQTGIHLQ
jgi:tripartite-type tricarboxylate transporter receptor subunit TctC